MVLGRHVSQCGRQHGGGQWAHDTGRGPSLQRRQHGTVQSDASERDTFSAAHPRSCPTRGPLPGVDACSTHGGKGASENTPAVAAGQGTQWRPGISICAGAIGTLPVPSAAHVPVCVPAPCATGAWRWSQWRVRASPVCAGSIARPPHAVAAPNAVPTHGVSSRGRAAGVSTAVSVLRVLVTAAAVRTPCFRQCGTGSVSGIGSERHAVAGAPSAATICHCGCVPPAATTADVICASVEGSAGTAP